MRSRPDWRISSTDAAEAPHAAKAISAASALFRIDRVQPAADGPHSFLAHHAFVFGHQRAAVAVCAAADEPEEDLVALVLLGQVAQIRGHAAGDSLEAVAA